MIFITATVIIIIYIEYNLQTLKNLQRYLEICKLYVKK